MADWRGLTMQSNFTWSKALGMGAQVQSSSVLTALDPFNLNEQYGRQAFDRKFIYNAFLVYQPPFFKGQIGNDGTCWAAGRSQEYSLPGLAFRRRSVRPMAITRPTAHAMASAAPTTTWRMPCRLAPFPTLTPTNAAATTPLASAPAQTNGYPVNISRTG